MLWQRRRKAVVRLGIDSLRAGNTQAVHPRSNRIQATLNSMMTLSMLPLSPHHKVVAEGDISQLSSILANPLCNKSCLDRPRNNFRRCYRSRGQLRGRSHLHRCNTAETPSKPANKRDSETTHNSQPLRDRASRTTATAAGEYFLSPQSPAVPGPVGDLDRQRD
mmetsp:Transcript_39055/g.93513  ORF Transcript_39055/g.93513 Transcript_39055/m.93513 type:complete len:164 (+) Transcript_39055:2170-2661(+)